MPSRVTKLALLGLCLLLGRPGASNADDQTATQNVTLAAYSSDPAVFGFADSPSGTRIDSIWVSMSELRFRTAASCDGTSGPTLAGPVTADLIRPGSSGFSGPLPFGRYCALELTWRRSRGRAQDAPSVLRGAAIVVEGRRPDGLRFVLRSRLSSSPRLRAIDLRGFSIAGVPHMMVAADIARWMSGLDLSAAEISGIGTRWEVRIDDTINSELLAQFEQNVGAGLSLFPDANGNKLLDEDERAHPLAVGN